MKYLEYYNRWLREGYIDSLGLCITDVGKTNLFEFIKPTEEDIKTLRVEGLPRIFWGRGTFRGSLSEFTPLRQTIVLLLAAMNDEL